MNSDLSHLHRLAARVRRGDPEAANNLHQLIAPQLVRLVRRTLRDGANTSALDRRILAEARRALTGAPDQRPPDREILVQQVARRLCDNLLREAPQVGVSPHGLADTIHV